jgi:hypothetical protein
MISPRRSLAKLIFKLSLVSIHFLFIGINHLSAQLQTVPFYVECHARNAREATLVWGFNDWEIPDGFTYSAPTYLAEGILRTPMIRKADTFMLKIEVPVGDTLDWGILIGNLETEEYFSQTSMCVDSSTNRVILQESLIDFPDPVEVTDLPDPSKEYVVSEGGDFFPLFGGLAVVILVLLFFPYKKKKKSKRKSSL